MKIASRIKKYLGVLMMGFACYATAQNSITGTVVDELGPLPGASVMVQGTNNGVSTDFNGNFNLVDVEAGKGSLSISYLGYETTLVEFEVTEGETLNLGQISMQANSTQLEQVVLQGNYLPSQQKALNIKKNSLAIMEVLAADAIGKLPDRNAAEAVQRVSGVSIERDHGEGRYVIVRGTPIQWNSTLINGDRMPSTEGTSDNTGGTRAAPLDIFPSEMIQYVQVSKALTPDMEGDAIGGSVNFITKTAPSKQTLNVNLGYGYNDQAQAPVQNTSVLYGDRLADGKIGFTVSGTYWNRNWGTDNYEVVYDQDNQAINNLQLRDYLGTRTTAGANAGFEYVPNDNNKIYFRGMFTDFQDEETAREHIFSFEDDEFGVRVRKGIIGINLYGGEVGGNHNFGNNKFNLDWRFSTYTGTMESRNQKDTPANGAPAYRMAYFSAPVTYNNLTSDGLKYLDIDSPSGYNGDPFDNIQPNLSAPVGSDQLNLANQIAFQSQSDETDYTGQLDFTYTANAKLKIKSGMKMRQMELERGAPLDYYLYFGTDFGAPVSMSDLGTTPFPANGGFLSEIGTPYDNVLVASISPDNVDNLFTEEQLSSPLYFGINQDENNPSSAGSFYSGMERVMAGYLMADYDLTNELKLIGGVRYEHTNLEYVGNVVTTDENDNTTIERTTNDNDFGSFLPMVHLKYAPKENLNFRAAFTRTMARANFSELNPTETTVLITVPATVTRGNIGLEPTYSNNFDLMGEYFFDNVGLLSGGVFYKALENVIYSARSFETVNGNFAQVIQPENSESGYLAGFELGFSKRLTFLPGFLSGIGVEGNYTFADSEMDVPMYETDAATGEVTVTTTKEKIPNQSNHIFNASVFYEKGPVTMRFAGNYKGESLALVQGNPENYRWYDKNFTVDLSAAYSVTKRLKIYLEMNNLTNEPLRYYQGVSGRPEQTEFYAMRGILGLNYNLF